MALAIDPSDILTYLSGVAFLIVAVLLLRAGAPREQTRGLLGLLFLEAYLALMAGTVGSTMDAGIAWAAVLGFMAGFVFLSPTYLGFLATLDSRLARFLRRAPVRFLPWPLPMVGLATMLNRVRLLVVPPDRCRKRTLSVTSQPIITGRCASKEPPD